MVITQVNGSNVGTYDDFIKSLTTKRPLLLTFSDESIHVDVKARIAYFNALFAGAVQDAFAEAKALTERDATKAAEERQLRRHLLTTKFREDARRKRAPRPTFENVAGSPDEIIVELKSPGIGDGGTVLYAILNVTGKLHTKVAWTTYHDRIKITTPGKYAVLTKLVISGRPAERRRPFDDDLDRLLSADEDESLTRIEAILWSRCQVESEVATTVYELGQSPPSMQYEGCPKELTFLNDVKNETCIKCGTSQKLYSRGSYVICRACALKGAAVMMDPGARRMWFSQMISFVGNRAIPLPKSQPLLTQILRILQANPGIAVRFEGHVNSICGFDCDGTKPCRHSTDHCRSTPGGSYGLSFARANAVKAFVLACGIAPDRVHAIGFSGTRRLVNDISATSGHLNRRVEVHVLLS